MSFELDAPTSDSSVPFRIEMAPPSRPLISLQDRIDDHRPVDLSPIRSQVDQQRILDQQLSAAGINSLYGGSGTDLGRPTTGRPDRIDAQTSDTQASDTQALRLRLIEDDVRRHGREPGPVLTQLMRDNSVVGVGTPNPEILRRLREGGATHLVIDAPMSARAVIDEFNRTGNLDVSKLPIHLRDESSVDTLRSAHALGLTVVPGGSESGVSMRFRGPTMALSVMSVLDQRNQDPSNPNKVALWAGGWQLQDFSFMRRPGPQSEKTAVEELRLSNVRIATVNHQNAGTDSLAAKAASNLSQPRIVSTRDATDFGAYRDVLGIPLYVQADQIILNPPKQR